MVEASDGREAVDRMRERPTEIARRHVIVTPYPEDDVGSIVAAVGHEMLALGSDYPHAEGLADPLDFQKMIEDLSPEQQRWILRENGFRLVAGASRGGGSLG